MFVGYSCEVASDKICGSLPGNQLAGWKLRVNAPGVYPKHFPNRRAVNSFPSKKSLNLNLHLFVVGTN